MRKFTADECKKLVPMGKNQPASESRMWFQAKELSPTGEIILRKADKPRSQPPPKQVKLAYSDVLRQNKSAAADARTSAAPEQPAGLPIRNLTSTR